MNGALFFFIVSVVYIGLHQISHYNTLSHSSQYFGWIIKINLPQVKRLLSVCLKLSQSKNILFHLNSIGYTCYSCDRIRRGLFFSLSQLYTQVCIRFPLKYTVSLVSVFLVDYPKIFLSGKTTVYSLFHSVTVYGHIFLFKYYCHQLLQLYQT